MSVDGDDCLVCALPVDQCEEAGGCESLADVDEDDWDSEAEECLPAAGLDMDEAEEPDS